MNPQGETSPGESVISFLDPSGCLAGLYGDPTGNSVKTTVHRKE